MPRGTAAGGVIVPPKPLHRAELLELAGHTLPKREPAWPSPLKRPNDEDGANTKRGVSSADGVDLSMTPVDLYDRAEPLKLAGHALPKQDPSWRSPLKKANDGAYQLDPLPGRSHVWEEGANTEQDGNALPKRDPTLLSPLKKAEDTANQLHPLHGRSHVWEEEANTAGQASSTGGVVLPSKPIHLTDPPKLAGHTLPKLDPTWPSLR